MSAHKNAWRPIDTSVVETPGEISNLIFGTGISNHTCCQWCEDLQMLIFTGGCYCFFSSVVQLVQGPADSLRWSGTLDRDQKVVVEHRWSSAGVWAFLRGMYLCLSIFICIYIFSWRTDSSCMTIIWATRANNVDCVAWCSFDICRWAINSGSTTIGSVVKMIFVECLTRISSKTSAFLLQLLVPPPIVQNDLFPNHSSHQEQSCQYTKTIQAFAYGCVLNLFFNPVPIPFKILNPSLVIFVESGTQSGSSARVRGPGLFVKFGASHSLCVLNEVILAVCQSECLATLIGVGLFAFVMCLHDQSLNTDCLLG